MSTATVERSTRQQRLMRYVPILSWLPGYNRAWLSVDALAGLTLWGLVVPEAMAYAGVAGLPPQAGLYTLLAALLIYALLGTSRHLAVTATSATAALLASTVATVLVANSVISGSSGSVDPAVYQQYATAFVFVIGLVFLASGIARLGFITQFLSKPVMDGFVLGLAVFVTVGQLSKLFGVSKVDGNTVEKLVGLIRELPQANWTTFLVGASALALLFVLPRLSKRIPGGLIVLFGFIALSTVFELSTAFGVAVVGTVPQGLPTITLPNVPFSALISMIAPAIGVLLVAYSEGLGVARGFADKHGYEINADQELNAYAVTNIVSSLFGGMIAGGSMSASAVSEGAGARSQAANLIAWAVTLATVLFLTPLFTNLPEAVLAALIIHALWHILASRKLARVLEVSRTEFWLGVITFAGVIFVDVLQGMLLGLACSLLLMVYRSSRPHLSSLGRVPGVPGVYTDLTRHPDNKPVPGLLIVRLDAPLYYANALTVRDQIKQMIADSPPKALLLDVSVQDDLDITTADALEGLVKALHGQGIAVNVAEIHATVMGMGRKTGLLDLIGDDHIFPSVDAAAHAIAPALQEGVERQPLPGTGEGSKTPGGADT
ncbi:MAG: SulP family inorganic anion transporter [Anaerolineae bacterium]